jgi:hypothetical protein
VYGRRLLLHTLGGRCALSFLRNTPHFTRDREEREREKRTSHTAVSTRHTHTRCVQYTSHTHSLPDTPLLLLLPFVPYAVAFLLLLLHFVLSFLSLPLSALFAFALTPV